MSKFFARSVHQYGLISNEIPLRWYFLVVGGALLAMLFGVDAIIPRQPALESANHEPRLPRIRIHSELKGPEAVVIDTSRPTVVPTPTAQEDAAKTIMSPAPRATENVALLASRSLKQTDANELSKMEPKPKPHSNIGKPHTRRPPVSFAQRPAIGRFNGLWTFDQQDLRIRDSFAQLLPRHQGRGRARNEVAWAQTERTRRPHFGWFNTGNTAW